MLSLRIPPLQPQNQVQAQQPQQVSSPLQMMRTSSLCLERNDRHNEVNKLRVLTNADQEINTFFRDGAAGLVSLKEYPYIKKLYVTLNTGLPSSASVERLFSLGGRIFTPLRSRMTSEHFEMMMFLRVAHHFYVICCAWCWTLGLNWVSLPMPAATNLLTDAQL